MKISIFKSNNRTTDSNCAVRSLRSISKPPTFPLSLLKAISHVYVLFIAVFVLLLISNEVLAQNDTPADKLFKDAEALFQKKDFSKSASAFERFFFQHQSDPRRHEALYRQGLCEMEGGRARKAIEIWNKLFTVDRNSGKWSEASLLALEQLINYYGKNKEYQLQNKVL
ncbi:MAG: tetratricopeptide repeat protein, partial [Lentisphaerae bacterium]|nr:tetratricopeptide repeat protein [Lentisphaerota bacterium]